MPVDKEAIREVWDSKIPVEFVLFVGNVTLIQQPKPYYVLVSRVSYFPLVLEKVHRYFLSLVDDENLGEPWLEADGLPLKWHYPIGVLHDLYKREETLPWRLVVHLRDFPEEELLACPSKEAVESNFIQSIKEADQLKHKGQIMNRMQKRDHKQLWNGLIADRFDQFWSVNKRLVQDENNMKCLPIRIHQSDGPFTQKPWMPFAEDGRRRTLADLTADLPPRASTTLVISHGVQIPLETPLLWLAENLAYPDNFVHLCLVERKD